MAMLFHILAEFRSMSLEKTIVYSNVTLSSHRKIDDGNVSLNLLTVRELA